VSGWFDTLGSELRFDGRSRVRVDRVRTPTGDEVEREIVEHDDAVAVVPVNAAGEVLLLRQYRHAVGGYLLEIPAGTLDVEDEEPEAAAQRELREEVEHEARELRPLTTMWNSAGWSEERTTIYLGTGCEPAAVPDGFEPRDEEADMEVVRLPLDAVLEAVHAGDITDAKTIVGMLLAAPLLR
jgi:8-oxo-dGTP pyrophosphatase MutT (NUDIX family)